MNRTLLLVCACAGLVGCAHGPAPDPEIRTQTVYVERPVSCVPDNLDEEPVYPDTDEALTRAIDFAERYNLLRLGRALRKARAAQTEPVIRECREAGNE